MKKFKYLFIALIFSVLLVYLYQNHIYYLIPHNPLDELATDTLATCYLRVNGDIEKRSQNLNNNALIFKYLSDLNLIPVNLKNKTHRDEIFKHDYNNYYSYGLKFGSPTYYVHINEIWLDNPTFMYIGSSRPSFRSGYYKIIDSKFDYMYVNKLINDSEN